MKSRVQLIKERYEILEMTGLIEVYEEAAAVKLRTIKKEIVQAREYMQGLHETMLAVGADMPVNPKRGEIGGRAILWLSSQKGLFGPIVDSTRRMVGQLVAIDPEIKVYIAGERGISLWRSWWPDKNFEIVNLTDEQLSAQEIARIVATIPNYRELVVVYGQFVNLLNQEPVARSLVSGTVGREIEVVEKAHKAYLYEPGYERVAEVFGKEIATLLLTQMDGESRLSKYASRMIHLEQTMEKVTDDNVKLRRELRRADARSSERKQQARLTQMYARSAI